MPQLSVFVTNLVDAVRILRQFGFPVRKEITMKTKKAMPALLLAASVLAAPFAMAQGGAKSKPKPMTDPMAASAPAAQNSPYMQVQQWKKGDRLPTEFRDRQYVIDDYKQYNLPAPRKGTRWVGIGAEYYLVAPNGVVQQVGSGS
jgi:Ni/Co efflux regulator RcnB